MTEAGQLPDRFNSRLVTYIAVTVLLGIGFYALRDVDYVGSPHLHTLMELAATLLSLMVGIIAIIRYYSKKNTTILFIGAGFLGTFLLDGYHTIVTSEWFITRFSSADASLIAWSWNASRIFLALLMFFSWWGWKLEEKHGQTQRVPEFSVYLFVATLTGLDFLFFTLLHLPPAYFNHPLIGRPEEFISAVFFGAALVGYLSKGNWRRTQFEHWVVLALIVSTLDQSLFMPFSHQPFDTMFDLAHLLKKLSYILVLTGLFISTYHLFRQGEATAEELRGINQKLQESEQKYRQIIEESVGTIYTADVYGYFTYVNPSGEKLTGYRASELLRRHFTELVQDNARAQVQAFYLRQLQDRIPETYYEFPITTKTGEEKWVEQHVRLIEKDGHVQGFQSIVNDITERKRFQNQLLLQSKTLEAAANAILVTDANGIIQWANPAFTQLTGYPIDFAVGKTPKILRSGLHPKSFYSRLWDTILSGEVWHGEIQNKKKSGELYTEEMTITPVLDEKGKIQNFIAIKQDITDRIENETRTLHSLRAQKALNDILQLSLRPIRLEELLKSALDHILLLDWLPFQHRGGIFLTDDSRDHLELVVAYQLPPSVRERCARVPIGTCICGRAAAEKIIMHTPRVDEQHVIHYEGMEDHGHYSVPFVSENEVLGVLVLYLNPGSEANPEEIQFLESVATILTGLIIRKRVENELLISKINAEEASRTKSQFLANMSHELRTPLNSIIGFSNVLLKKLQSQVAEQDLNYLDRILSNGKHLLMLINDILDISKIEAQQVQLESIQFVLQDLVTEVLTQMDIQAKAKSIYLRAELPEEPIRLLGDPAKLKQIIMNLVSNAVKFTDTGGVTVRVNSTGEETRLDVIDTGIGIPEDRIDHIFREFQQVDSSTSRKYGGTGLGLAISYSLCELMGYHLSVTSQPGSGSTFTIQIPPATLSETPAETASGAGKSAGTLAGKQLVIIEDEEDAREILHQYLAGSGCKLKDASTGKTGIALVHKVKPDAIILDMKLPDISGQEVYRQIRASSPVPIVVISVEPEHLKFDDDAAVTLVTKPVEKDQLIGILSSLFSENSVNLAQTSGEDSGSS